MPNWCSNYLEISGNEKSIKSLKERAVKESVSEIYGKEQEVFSFDQFVHRLDPVDWYRWNIDNWGTKWDASDSTILAEEEKFLSYSLSTAWSPPIEFLKKLSGMYPDLSFHMEFEEGGCSIYGEVTFENGELTYEKDYDYDGWLEHSNEDYRAFKQEVLEMTSREAIRTLEEEDIEDWSPIEKYLLERVEDQDLPLLINHEWLYVQDEYEQRLKNAKEISNG